MKTIYSSDINVLLQLYAPHDYLVHVFDPFGRLVEDEPLMWNHGSSEQQIIINLGNEIQQYRGLAIHDYDLVINFGKKLNLNHRWNRSFNYINGPEKRVRWYYQKGNLQHVLSCLPWSEILDH